MVSTMNDFFFGSNGRQIAPMLPVTITTREQGLRTAAWIMLMSETLPSEDETRPDFSDVLRAISDA